MESELRRPDRASADVDRYVRGYREHPQTNEEWGWTDEVAIQSLIQVPWDDEATADPASSGEIE